MNSPVPNFCLDHRFVRPNYARQRATFRCSETGAERLARPIGRPLRRFCLDAVVGTAGKPNVRLGGWSFQMIKKDLLRIFLVSVLLCALQYFLLTIFVHCTILGP